MRQVSRVPVPESLQMKEDKCTVRPLQRKETQGFKENKLLYNRKAGEGWFHK